MIKGQLIYMKELIISHLISIPWQNGEKRNSLSYNMLLVKKIIIGLMLQTLFSTNNFGNINLSL